MQLNFHNFVFQILSFPLGYKGLSFTPMFVRHFLNFTLNTVKKNLLLILNRNFIFMFFRKKKLMVFSKMIFLMSSTFSLGLVLLFFTYVHVLVDSLPDEFLSKEGCCLLRITYNLIFVKKRGAYNILFFISNDLDRRGGGGGVAVVNAC